MSAPAVALPLLLSIPHGGTRIPDEVAPRVALSEFEWRIEDSDAFTREIFDLGSAVDTVLVGDVARFVIDLNRSPDDRPPSNRDGVVKSHTCYGRATYREGWVPNDATIANWLRQWHAPYHDRLTSLLTASDAASRFRFALDCHSMAAHPPMIAPDDKPRPLLCLGNLHGATCSQAHLDRLAKCLATAWEIPTKEVALNEPFAGGYILKRHGHGSVPWAMIEINRALFLAKPWFEERTLSVEPTRLAWLHDRFLHAVCQFADYLAE